MSQVLTLNIIKMRCRICGECWEYQTEAKTEHHRRHPQVKHNGEHHLVRRLAYEMGRGHIEPSRRIVPACDNPYCVNPDHQKALTESQKNKRAANRGAFSNPVRA